MMPWTITYDLMRAKEEETIRAIRYAQHRTHTRRRPGRFLASLLQAWMSKIPVPRHVHTAPKNSTPMTPDPLRLAVPDLGGDDIDGLDDASGEPPRTGRVRRDTGVVLLPRDESRSGIPRSLRRSP
jgi:hypothetical protein